jgi:hypothetical protein
MMGISSAGGADDGAADPYAAAIGHYASAGRSDLVKTHWERPVSVGLIRQALQHLRAGGAGPAIHALDVGAGAGEGFDLLDAAVRQAQHPLSFRYTALDRSSAMLRLAVERLAGRAGLITPIAADIVDYPYTDDPAQLYLSSGAPYSELSDAAFGLVLEGICAAISRRPQPAAMIVDVYGRYCPAWLPVSAPRWVYSMSFFRDTQWPPTRDMAFYTPGQIEHLFTGLLTGDLRARLVRLAFADRSVFAGRHTAGGAYNPRLPRIRTIVNALLAGDTAVAPAALHIPADTVRETRGFRDLGEQAAKTLASRVDRWNELARQEPLSTLLARLHALNDGFGADAIGAGHYLTMLAFFSAG